MKKYRKKPVVVEVKKLPTKEEMSGDREPRALIEIAAWVKATSLDYNRQGAVIKTLRGEFFFGWGDYIIKGEEGGIYPCAPEDFKETYEEVEQ